MIGAAVRGMRIAELILAHAVARRLVVSAIVAVACAIGVVPQAWANWIESCPQLRAMGPVKTITVWEIVVDVNRAPTGKTRKISESLVSRNRRNMTVINHGEHSLNTMTERSPRYVLDFDDKGRLTTQALRVAGVDQDIIRCEYDPLGRVSNVTHRSPNPDPGNLTISHSYGDNWRSQRIKSTEATVLITQYLDGQGRPLRETRVHETFREKSERQFEYIDDVTRVCSVRLTGEKSCTGYRYDKYGNLLEAKSERGFRTSTYDYDSYGNWILERVESATTGRARSFRDFELRRREIVYWDQKTQD